MGTTSCWSLPRLLESGPLTNPSPSIGLLLTILFYRLPFIVKRSCTRSPGAFSLLNLSMMVEQYSSNPCAICHCSVLLPIGRGAGRMRRFLLVLSLAVFVCPVVLVGPFLVVTLLVVSLSCSVVLGPRCTAPLPQWGILTSSPPVRWRTRSCV